MSTPPQPVQGNPNAPVLEKHEDGLATLTLNRPEKMNAINTEMAVAFNEALTRISVDKNLHEAEALAFFDGAVDACHGARADECGTA